MLPIKHPDLLVHIRVSFDTMLERIENVVVRMNNCPLIQVYTIITKN